MLHNRVFISIVLILLAVVIVYNIYYFVFTKQSHPTEIQFSGSGTRPASNPIPNVASRTGSEKRTMRSSTGVPDTRAKTPLDFNELLSRINPPRLVAETHTFPLDPFRRYPNSPMNETEGAAVTPVPVQTIHTLDLALSAIMVTDDASYAFINEYVATVGDEINGVIVKEISPDSVVLQQGSESRTLTLFGSSDSNSTERQ